MGFTAFFTPDGGFGRLEVKEWPDGVGAPTRVEALGALLGWYEGRKRELERELSAIMSRFHQIHQAKKNEQKSTQTYRVEGVTSDGGIVYMCCRGESLEGLTLRQAWTHAAALSGPDSDGFAFKAFRIVGETDGEVHYEMPNFPGRS